MTAAARGTDVVVAFKKQAGLGTPASGGSGTLIEVRPSTGLALASATIQSQMIRRNGMRQKPRPGSNTVTAQYETELQVGNLDNVIAGALGCTATATFNITNTDVTDITLVGATGVFTTTSGSLLSLGLRAGMMVKFASLSVSGNNSKWIPVLAVTALTFTTVANLLADNATDSGFTMTVAKSFSTPTPRLSEYFTFEEYLGAGLDTSKYGTDMMFNSLNFTCAPNTPVTVGWGLTGLSLSAPTGGSAPTLTSPVANAQSGPSSLVLLDGAIYRNGVAAADLTGFTFGMSSQASVTPLLSSRTGNDVVLTMFDFAGQFTGLLQDTTAFASFLAEDRISIFARFGERESDPADFVSVYIGDASYGNWNAPISDGQIIQTIPIYAGSDGRGAGYNDTTFLFSTSAA